VVGQGKRIGKHVDALKPDPTTVTKDAVTRNLDAIKKRPDSRR
jgi:hypothetical protein